MLLCLALSLSGAAAYLLLLDVHWLHRSGAPLFATLALGAMWATRNALRTRRRWVRIACVANVLLLPLGLYAFFVAARLPRTTPPQIESSIPELTLLDQQSRPVQLSEVVKQGPLLLVFYRGHW
ncbi:MAG: hypothetical protein IPM64_05410 [Phycisphaerales bacterium]|nr:hypothetical protein [Phycisphaerales bacterium]